MALLFRNRNTSKVEGPAHGNRGDPFIDLNKLLSSRRGMSNDARNVAIYLARRLSGQTLSTIGGCL